MSLEVDRPHHPGSHCFQVLLADAACTTFVSCVYHALSLEGVVSSMRSCLPQTRVLIAQKPFPCVPLVFMTYYFMKPSL